MLKNAHEERTLTLQSIYNSVGSTLLSFLSANDLKIVRCLDKASFSLVNEQSNVTWEISEKNRFWSNESETASNIERFLNTFGKSKLSKFDIDVPPNATQRTLDKLMKLKNVHRVVLWRNKNILNVSAMENVHTLNLCGTKVADVSALGNVSHFC